MDQLGRGHNAAASLEGHRDQECWLDAANIREHVKSRAWKGQLDRFTSYGSYYRAQITGIDAASQDYICIPMVSRISVGNG